MAQQRYTRWYIAITAVFAVVVGGAFFYAQTREAPPPAAAQPASKAAFKDTFTSQYVSTPLALHRSLFSPWEAEIYQLPLMKNHPELFSGKNVLEVGTGVGLTSIYAAKLGAKKVVATDIEPLAVEYTQKNAKAAGVGGAVEARLVPRQSPGAFSAVKPEEKFDVILANLPYVLDLEAPAAGVPTNDNGALITSLIDGLQAHLAPGGRAILLYRTFFTQQFAARYARMKGYAVRLHATDRISQSEINVMYKLFSKTLLEKRGIDPKQIDMQVAVPHSLRLYKPKAPQPLFDNDTAYYNGMVVISLK